MAGAVVYRAYDANCHLLYVGISTNFTGRIATHKSVTPWFTEIDTMSLEHFATLAEARAAETAAIKTEKPRYNVQHHPERAYRPRRRMRKPDESTWPTAGLVMNPAFYDEWMDLRCITIDQVAEHSGISADFILGLRNWEYTATLEQATALCDVFLCAPAAMFPNRNPIFAHDGERFVSTGVNRRDRRKA